jgi:GNAT superfamily N-acetyltransferase
VISESIQLRPGTVADGPVILDMWDGAIAWMVARGQTAQWGSEPASSRPRTREIVDEWVNAPGVTMAELDGRPVGVCVVTGTRPDHVPAIPARESYVQFLLSSRAHAGLGIGSLLIRHAASQARAAGSEVLRVDCWAGAPSLVAWYERQGFVRSDTFLYGDWPGQVFEMQL